MKLQFQNKAFKKLFGYEMDLKAIKEIEFVNLDS
jgi:hypothetical protein